MDDKKLKYLITPMAGVVLPVLQAGITALGVGMLAGSVAWIRGSNNPIGISFISAAAVFLLVWFLSLDSWRGLVRNDPLPTYQAINNRADTVRVELIKDNGHWGDWLDLPIDQARMIEMAKAVINDNKEFSLASFGGRGKLLSRNQFELLRDDMIALGLARWVSKHTHNRGCELTGSGRAIFRKYASMSPTNLELF